MTTPSDPIPDPPAPAEPQPDVPPIDPSPAELREEAQKEIDEVRKEASDAEKERMAERDRQGVDEPQHEPSSS